MELICAVQNYHWGKLGVKSLVGTFASANSQCNIQDDKPYSEFWMGTHPNGPSLVKSTKEDLIHYLSLHPHELGCKVIEEFGMQLPFLLKILSVEEPLSIQAHPTKAHAEELFKKFPAIYKDCNHKPELAIALTNFEALCGFRPVSEIKNFLQNIPEFSYIVRPEIINAFCNTDDNSEECKKLMKECFQNLMNCGKERISTALDKLLLRTKNFNSCEDEEFLIPLVKRINSKFINDVGVFCVYWLNYIIMMPGEALYLAPNEPHAYLSGDCIECMANSDNVVRAGLTPKFRDVETLCNMLTYKNHHASDIYFLPIKDDDYCYSFIPPVKDFAVSKIILPKTTKYDLKKKDSGSILLVLNGSGYLNDLKLEFGKVFFVPAEKEFKIESFEEGLILYQAFCNV